MKAKLAPSVVLSLALVLFFACSGGSNKAPAPATADESATAEKAPAKDVIRSTAGKFPIARAVEVPTGKMIVYLSGALAPISDASKPKDSEDAYGDMETQTYGALKDMGLTMGDVIKM